MRIPIVIELTESGSFRARTINACVEGQTSDDAMESLRCKLHELLKDGRQVVMIEVESNIDNPWLKMVGRLKDDPIVEEWRAAVEEFRRQRDIEAGIEYVERRD